MDVAWTPRPDLDGRPWTFDHQLFQWDGASLEKMRSTTVDGLEAFQGSLRYSGKSANTGGHTWKYRVFGATAVPADLPAFLVRRRRGKPGGEEGDFSHEFRVQSEDPRAESVVGVATRQWLVKYWPDRADVTLSGGLLSVHTEAKIFGGAEHADRVGRMIIALSGVMLPELPAPAPSGRWAPDPSGRHEQRWWDGTRWTEHVSDGTTTGTDPVA